MSEVTPDQWVQMTPDPSSIVIRSGEQYVAADAQAEAVRDRVDFADRVTVQNDLAFGNAPFLQAGDVNEDLQFDSADIILALQANKFRTGEPATWEEGDWNGAPSGTVGNPPPGDGVFDQFDLIAALKTGLYNARPYALQYDSDAAIPPTFAGPLLREPLQAGDANMDSRFDQADIDWVLDAGKYSSRASIGAS